ncbi:MAG: DegV family protein [Oscillospiraceae bacterium]
MNYRIIADSCCDATPELCKDLGIEIVPLTLTLEGKSYTDDDELDLPQFMEDMKNCTGRIGSASPSPVLFKEAFQGIHTSFAVTLSKNLSGSFLSAMLGKEMAEEEEEGADVHVFDSKSASAGEVLVALKIAKMIGAGFQKEKIISHVESFISEMKTYFVLENIDNLLKNGRMGKITGKIISALNIKPIMGADKDGNIALFSHARGQRQIIEKLADTIEKSGRDVEGESMVIAHCNNPGLAERLMEAIKKRYRFREIFIVPTRGISTIYANDKGIVMAF